MFGHILWWYSLKITQKKGLIYGICTSILGSWNSHSNDDLTMILIDLPFWGTVKPLEKKEPIAIRTSGAGWIQPLSIEIGTLVYSTPTFGQTQITVNGCIHDGIATCYFAARLQWTSTNQGLNSRSFLSGNHFMNHEVCKANSKTKPINYHSGVNVHTCSLMDGEVEFDLWLPGSAKTKLTSSTFFLESVKGTEIEIETDVTAHLQFATFWLSMLFWFFFSLW